MRTRRRGAGPASQRGSAPGPFLQPFRRRRSTGGEGDSFEILQNERRRLLLDVLQSRDDGAATTGEVAVSVVVTVVVAVDLTGVGGLSAVATTSWKALSVAALLWIAAT